MVARAAVFLTLALCVCACGGGTRHGPPAQSYGSTEHRQVESFTARLEEIVPGLLQGYGVPGVSVALVQSGELAWAGGFGLSDTKSGQRVGVDTLFAVNSLSKPVTAWGILKLAEHGKLDLDAPIDDYLTRWHLPDSSFDRRLVTARTLLNHTSGVSEASFNPRAQSLEASLKGDAAFYLPAIIDHRPGEFRYSDHNYSILQLVIEEVTDKKFATYMRDEVLSPLGMNSSSFEVSWEVVSAAAIGHTNALSDRIYLATDAVQAPFGLNSSAADMGRFLAAHLVGTGGTPGRDVLSAQAMGELLTPVAPGGLVAGVPADGYGLGVMIQSGPPLVIGHSSGIGRGWTSAMAAVPSLKAGIVILANGDTSGPMISTHLICEWKTWLGAPPSGCSGLSDIYRIGRDGTGLQRLTSGAGSEHFAQWSPDGSRLAFMQGPFWEISITDCCSEEHTPREVQIKPRTGNFVPVWSHDGAGLYFVSRREGNHDLFVVRADGGSPQALTRTPENEDILALSPDARQIAFLRTGFQSQGDAAALWVMNVDGTGERFLADASLRPFDWSPDGLVIAFVLDEEIYTVPASGGAPVRLTFEAGGSSDPSWSPDGNEIAFTANSKGAQDIAVMNKDGSERRIIFASGADDFMPQWSPDGEWIAFSSNRTETQRP